MSSPSTFILLQYGTDPLSFEFEDSEGQVAFTSSKVMQLPNVIVQLSRKDDWAAKHTQIMGPRNAYFFFGPSSSPGQIAYGNGDRNAMMNYLRRKKDNSSSRYFTSQSGKEFKWKSVSSQRMELCDSRSTFAIWEKAPLGLEHDAQITLSPFGVTFVTEVLTTLALNIAAKRLDFW